MTRSTQVFLESLLLIKLITLRDIEALGPVITSQYMQLSYIFPLSIVSKSKMAVLATINKID